MSNIPRKPKYTPTKEHTENRLRAIRGNALADKNNMRATAYIRQLSKEGISIREIARRLNADGFETRRGKEFNAWQVILLAERAGIELPGRKHFKKNHDSKENTCTT
jgi:allantoicase